MLTLHCKDSKFRPFQCVKIVLIRWNFVSICVILTYLGLNSFGRRIINEVCMQSRSFFLLLANLFYIFYFSRVENGRIFLWFNRILDVALLLYGLLCYIYRSDREHNGYRLLYNVDIGAQIVYLHSLLPSYRQMLVQSVLL